MMNKRKFRSAVGAISQDCSSSLTPAAEQDFQSGERHLGMKYPKCSRFINSEWLTPNTYGENYSDIPHSSGIYAFVKVHIDDYLKPAFEVLYVGKSANIANRMQRHDILPLCRKRMGYVSIYFFHAPKDKIGKLEVAFIRGLHPRFNLQHRVREVL